MHVVGDRKFRLKWPWEQDRQMAVYNRSSHLIQVKCAYFIDSIQTCLILHAFIQVASQPERAYQSHRPAWCLSHLPGSGCFIQHYCQNGASKARMNELYRMPGPDTNRYISCIYYYSCRECKILMTFASLLF